MALTGNPNVMFRGTTVVWPKTIFYDADGNVTQPSSATINIVFPTPNGGQGTEQAAMTPPTSPAIAWTAQWDSRGKGPGVVYWSIHTGSDSPEPVAVEDGQFTLTANPANLVTF